MTVLGELHCVVLYYFGSLGLNISCNYFAGEYDGAAVVYTRIYSETKGKEGKTYTCMWISVCI